MNPNHQRREIFFSGRVQGVGFRYTAQRLARPYSITGFVRNLADGRVQLVVEGLPSEIDSLVADIEQAMRDNIHGQQSTTAPPTGEFDTFSVAH